MIEEKIGVEEQEEWRPVPGFEDYCEVSNLGRFRRFSSRQKPFEGPETVKPVKNGVGYMLVRLGRYSKAKRVGVHQLVMMAFVGPCPEGHEVHHKDEDKTNNRLSNLCYLTFSEHKRLTWASGQRKPGKCSLKDADVRVIRRLRGQVQAREIAEWYRVSPETVFRIWERLRYGRVPDVA
jgi:hypothetical protein